MVFISNGKKLHVSACGGHHQVLTTFLLKELYKIWINLIARKLSKPDDGHHMPKHVVFHC